MFRGTIFYKIMILAAFSVGIVALGGLVSPSSAATKNTVVKTTPKPTATPTPAMPTLTIADYFNIRLSTSELKAAGFTDPVAVVPIAHRYAPPTYYFRVKEAPIEPTGAAWGDTKNLVSVLIRPIADKKWVYNKNEIQLIDLGGRFEARASSPGYYLVVAGPDKDKVIVLLHNLKVLY